MLDAAASLFGETGSRGTSIAAIAERAGLTDAGVLYHFKTKEQLLISVVQDLDERIEHGMTEAGLQGIDMIRAVRRWGRLMESAPEIQSMHIVLSAEQLHNAGRARDYFVRRYRTLHDRYSQAFADAAADGDLRADLDPAFEASAVIAHLDGIRLQWFLLDGATSMARSVETYIDHLLERLAPLERTR